MIAVTVLEIIHRSHVSRKAESVEEEEMIVDVVQLTHFTGYSAFKPTALLFAKLVFRRGKKVLFSR